MPQVVVKDKYKIAEARAILQSELEEGGCGVTFKCFVKSTLMWEIYKRSLAITARRFLTEKRGNA